jgi:glycosyltransferase 2 family protein
LKKTFLNVLKVSFFLCLGIFFIWLFLHNLTSEQKKEIYHSFINANYFWIFISFIFAVLSHISRTLRWKILLEPLGYNPGNKNVFFAIMVGYFANLALPRLGEITRCGILSKYEKIPLQKSFGTVITERGLDLIMLILIFIAAVFIHFKKFKIFKDSALYNRIIANYNKIENPTILLYFFLIICVILIFILFKFRHRISHLKIYIRIKTIFFDFLEGIKSLVSIKKPFWFVFHTLFIWFMYLCMTWITLLSLPETSHLTLGDGLAVLVFGSIAIIIIQGGIGIYPWIVAEILAMFAITATSGYAMGWLLWTGQTIMIIIAGLASLILLPILNNKTHATKGINKFESI